VNLLNIMLTKTINIKEYRRNLTKIWKEAREKKQRIIVLNHSKPVFEVWPVYKNHLEFESKEISQKERFALVEKSFSFWKSNEDENLFKS